MLGTILVVVAQSSHALVESLPQSIKFQHLLENKDITLGEVQSFLQDSEGFMWIGCNSGLVRYDGYEFKFILETVQKEKESIQRQVKNVQHIYEDSEHILWISTRTGLLRYDPRSELLHALPDAKNNLPPISMTFFLKSIELPTGELLIVSLNGLFVLNRHTYEYSVMLPDSTKKDWLQSKDLKSIYIDKAGALWLGSIVGLEKIDWLAKKATLFKPDPEHPNLTEANTVNDIVEDKDGHLWLATFNGLVKFDPATQKTKRYVYKPADKRSLLGKEVAKLMVDSKGALWVASDGGGIAFFEKTEQHPEGRFNNQYLEEGKPNSLVSDVVRAVYEDRAGDIWVGHYPAGISFFDRSGAAITSYSREILNSNSLSNSAILAVREDAKQNLWLGTDGGGLNYFDREKSQFRHYINSTSDEKTTISNDAVLDVFVEGNGNVWAGTWGGGVSILNPVTGEFRRMPFDTSRPTTQSVSASKRLNNGRVWTIKEDRQKNIWLGTHNGGLSKFDRATETYTHYVNIANELTSISPGPVWDTLEDSKGNFWVATEAGLDLMDRATGTFKHFRANPKEPNSLSSSTIITIFEDSKHRLWFGTASGLNLLNADGKTFTAYLKPLGFNDDRIRTILEDAEGQLWLATNNGISVFNPDTREIKNYNRDGGRLMGGFHNDSGLLSSKGEIMFGGVEGLRIFDPHKLKSNNVIPHVAFTDFKIFSDPVKVGGQDGILKKAINHTPAITLDHTKSMFEFGFSALDFRDSAKNKYAYKMEGFDENWLDSGGQHTAKYTNLDAGEYVFKVKGSNNDGLWNEAGASIKITILPPIWRSWVAYFLYSLMLVILVANYLRSQRAKLKEAKKKIVIEKLINERLINIDKLKENFLANTSHELRTPLNGIIGLAESISASHVDLPLDVKQKAEMILFSGKRLKNIVNEIIDFSQLANNELTLTLSEVPLHSIVTGVLMELQERINDKALLVFANIPEEVVVFSNAHRLSQIMHHLIDNAIKFTNEGSITIAHHRTMTFDFISVTDTGVGIAPENIGAIFSAFQQVDGSAKRAAEGAGLGLSVIQKLIELHNGEIKVESVLEKGTTFHVCLPLVPENSALHRQDIVVSANESNRVKTDSEAKSLVLSGKTPDVHNVYFNSQLYAGESCIPEFSAKNKKYKILVVDDDSVNRMVVKAHLRKQNFNTVEAVDGDDALKVMAETNDIDLILLDVMMPHMTGYEACEILRKKYSLHKLPIIFLTANHQPCEVIKAFYVGGNDFMTKPITAELLCNKVKNHLTLLEESRNIEHLFSVRISSDSLGNRPAEKSVENTAGYDVNNAIKHYISLQNAVAHVIEQAFNLVTPIDVIGCWIQNHDNNFECVDNLPTLPALAAHAPLTWQELERLTDIVGKANKNISLIKNLTDAARAGRLGNNFINVLELHCELIFRENFIIGFIIIGGSITKFMAPEDYLALSQCQTHIAAAVTKMQKIHALSYNAERTLS